jgi:hypothetical protein
MVGDGFSRTKGLGKETKNNLNRPVKYVERAVAARSRLLIAKVDAAPQLAVGLWGDQTRRWICIEVSDGAWEGIFMQAVCFHSEGQLSTRDG